MSEFNKKHLTYLKSAAKKIRLTVLNMISTAGASHIASSYSIVDLVVFLYEHVLNVNPKKPYDANRDRFILSKGWGVSAIYAVLARKGFFDPSLLDTYCQNGSKMIGSSTKNSISGIEETTGSMGHGLPIGVGIALAAKMQKKDFKVFVLLSDGECDEGTTWESALLASHHKLNNLIVVIDCNKWQSFGRTKDVLSLEPLIAKWKAFNWEVSEIDGHNFDQMKSIFNHRSNKKTYPSVIIAHTTKGKGVSIFEDRNEWHYKTPSEKEIKIAQRELL